MAATNDPEKSFPPSPIFWIKVLELGYSTDQLPEGQNEVVCFCCGIDLSKKTPSRCARCRVAAYCSKECQIADWKNGGHKYSCDSYKRIGLDQSFSSQEEKMQACSDIFGRIRFYACSYAVYKSMTLGKGFLFVQSDRTLATMSLLRPKDGHGRPVEMRSVLLHYLTLGEFDAEVCRDDFELAEVRSELQKLVIEGYDQETEVVLLMRFRCGYLALGRAPLVPDYRVCKKLGSDYFANSNDAGALQLNLDDM